MPVVEPCNAALNGTLQRSSRLQPCPKQGPTLPTKCHVNRAQEVKSLAHSNTACQSRDGHTVCQNLTLQQSVGTQQQSQGVPMLSLSPSPVLHAQQHGEPGRRLTILKKLSVLMNLWAANHVRKMICTFSGQPGFRCLVLLAKTIWRGPDDD